MDALHGIIEPLARALELAGAAIIIAGVALGFALFLRCGIGTRDWQTAYEGLRANLGRGILLGLELLVGADIILTITTDLDPDSVLLLGGVVLIRTFLSFSLETEIEGVAPWRRAEARGKGTAAASR
jgi:uncharacterized membrane protein